MNNKKSHMNTNPFRSLLAMLCVFALLARMIPPVAATEIDSEAPAEASAGVENAVTEVPATEAVSTEVAGDTAPEASEGNNSDGLLEYLRGEIAAYMTTYQLAADMPDQALADAYFALDSQGAMAAWDTANTLLVQAEGLSPEDAEILLAEQNTKLCLRFYRTMEQINSPSMLADTDLSSQLGIADLSVKVSDTATAKYENGVITITASSNSSTGCDGSTDYTTKNVTVTFQNTSTTETKTLSFSYTPTNCDSLSIAGSKNPYSADLDVGETLSITFSTQDNANTSTLTISGVELSSKAASSKITINYNSSLGTVVQGDSTTAMTSGSTVTISADETFTATATASGAVFLGWISSDSVRKTTDNAYTVSSTGDQTLTAVFATTSPWFLVDNTYLVEGLAAAAEKGSVMALMNNATLPSGTHTIDAGKTLLIPYADNTAAYTNPLAEPERMVETSATPTLFRKLTVSQGATIDCYGNIRVDSRQSALSTQYAGRVYGAYGQIELANGATLNLKTESTLRAYGYITGSGTVNTTGATIYELFQMSDWRGGRNVSSLYRNLEDQSFLVSQYYVQNIESTLILDSSTKLIALLSIAAGITTKEEYSNTAEMIGPNGLFQLEDNAKISRVYTSSGRIEYTINGNLKLGSISLTVDTGIIGEITMDSSDYVLNLPSNMTIEIASGTTTFPIRAKLLPGTILQIDEGATMQMTSSTIDSTTVGAELIIYDNDDWKSGTYTYTGNFYPVLYAVSGKLGSLPAGPGQLIVNGTLTVNDGAAIYSTNKTGTTGNNGLSGSGKIAIGAAPTSVRSVIKEVTGSNTTLTDIAVTPLQALLKGFSTSATDYTHSMANSRTYYGSDGYWYNYVVNTGSADNVSKFTNVSTAPASTTVTKYPNTVSNAIGLVSYNQAGTQSPFTFGLADCTAIDEANSTMEVSEQSGTYALNGVGGDVTLNLKDKHSFGDWETSVAATVNSKGEEKRICGTCGAEETRETDMLPAEAAIGESRFATLREALEVAGADTTITLLKDIESSVTISQEATIDMNGFGITIDPGVGYVAAYDENDAELVIISKFTISYASMTMANSLDMNFAFEKTHQTDWTGCTVEITKEYADGRENVTQKIEFGDDWKSATINGIDHYYVTFTGIAAKEMTDDIHVTIYKGDSAISRTWTDSVRAQAMRNLEQSTVTELAQTMVVDMLNYGAAAQIKKEYKTDDLANSLLNSEQNSFATEDVEFKNTCNKDSSDGYYANVVLESNLQFAMAFNANSGISDEMTAEITFADHYGIDKSYTLNVSDFGTDDNNYRTLIIKETVVADGRMPITCTFFNGQTEVFSVTDSIESYAARADLLDTTNSNICTMLMKFSDSAKAYLHDKLNNP